MKKNILLGLFVGILMLILGFGIGFINNLIFPMLKDQYANANLFRQMNDPISALYLVHPILLALILAFIWDKSKVLFTPKKILPRGAQFGLMYFLVVIPGIMISYACSPYSLTMVTSWLICVLVQALASGMLFERFNK